MTQQRKKQLSEWGNLGWQILISIIGIAMVAGAYFVRAEVKNEGAALRMEFSKLLEVVKSTQIVHRKELEHRWPIIIGNRDKLNALRLEIEDLEIKLAEVQRTQEFLRERIKE